jgi:hypothetical protein
MNCPNCKSFKIVKNGYTKLKRQRWKCNKCKKTFIENTYKKYPPTKYPFYFIAYILYTSEVYKPKSLTKYIKNWLKILKTDFKDVNRKTVHYWIKKYKPIYKEIIKFNEARRLFVKHIDKERYRPRLNGTSVYKISKIEELYGPYEDYDSNGNKGILFALGNPPKHKELIKSLIETLGEDMVKYLLKKFSREDLHRMYIKLNKPFTINLDNEDNIV